MFSLRRHFNALNKIGERQATSVNVLYNKNFKSNATNQNLLLCMQNYYSIGCFYMRIIFKQKPCTKNIKLNKVSSNEATFFFSALKLNATSRPFILNLLFNAKNTFRQFHYETKHFHTNHATNSKNMSATFTRLFNLFIKSFNVTLEQIKTNLFKNRSRLIASMSAVGIFSWDERRITDEDIKAEVSDIMSGFTIVNKQNQSLSSNENNQSYIRSIGAIDFEKNRQLNGNAEWKLIYDKKDLIIWKRKMEGIDEVGDLFEYKVLGRMYDITPLEFYQTQIDLEFRKQWDYLVVVLDMIEKDMISNTELVRWVRERERVF
jgi:hypothetical protein